MESERQQIQDDIEDVKKKSDAAEVKGNMELLQQYREEMVVLRKTNLVLLTQRDPSGELT